MDQEAKNLFFEAFDKCSFEEWKAKATKDLKGADVIEKFSWASSSGVKLAPYYDQENSSELDHLKVLHNCLFNQDKPTGDSRYWSNLEPILVSDEKNANSAALKVLNAGAEGLAFDLADKSDVDLNILLKDVALSYCDVNFNATSLQPELLKSLKEIAALQGIEPAAIQGVIFAPQSIDAFDFSILASYLKDNADSSRFFKIGLISPNADDPIHNQAKLLAQVVWIVDKLTDMGFNANEVLSNVAFSVNVGADFFLEIAQLRALRYNFYQLSQHFGATDITPGHLHIRGISELWSNEAYQPHEGMLKNSTSAMAAVLGGCNSVITVDEEDAKSRRVARNVSSILKEESYLNMVADPVAGSYYIEHLTDEIANKSWVAFQQIEKDGGFESLSH